MNFLIEKATELGVSCIIPILTEKSLVKMEEISEEDDSIFFAAKGKKERWRRLAIASLKQSLRSILPEIKNPIKFEEFLPQIKTFDLSLIASLEKGAKSLREFDELKSQLRNPKDYLRHVLIMVGPEAGFSEEEISQAKSSGAIPITLGSRRLRTETAGIVLSSLVLYELEDLG